MTLEVRVEAEEGAASPDDIRSAASAVLTDAGIERAELSVTLVDDEEIRRLNREYLAKNRVTDVIAFSLGDEGGVLVGDVYVGWEQAARQAAELGEDARVETLRLVIHGVLHVLGHDHPEGADRETSPMFVLQERLLTDFLSAR